MKKVKHVQQLVEVERLTTFSSKPIEGGFFKVETSFPDIPIIIPTKSRSKYMMRCWGKKQVVEGSSLANVTQK